MAYIFAAEATRPKTTKTSPTSMSRVRMERNAAPVTTAFAMFVVIFVTFAVGQIAVRLENAPITAKITIEKMPAISKPNPVVIMSARPAL